MIEDGFYGLGRCIHRKAGCVLVPGVMILGGICLGLLSKISLETRLDKLWIEGKEEFS